MKRILFLGVVAVLVSCAQPETINSEANETTDTLTFIDPFGVKYVQYLNPETGENVLLEKPKATRQLYDCGVTTVDTIRDADDPRIVLAIDSNSFIHLEFVQKLQLSEQNLEQTLNDIEASALKAHLRVGKLEFFTVDTTFTVKKLSLQEAKSFAIYPELNFLSVAYFVEDDNQQLMTNEILFLRDINLQEVGSY